LSRRHLDGACVANGQFRLLSEQCLPTGFAPSVSQQIDNTRVVERGFIVVWSPQNKRIVATPAEV
jgi:hypothetical protein